MAQDNVADNKGNAGAAEAEIEEMILLPPEEEVARLKKLKIPELVNELYFARQRLKTFLESHGIAVPELTFEERSHKAQLDISAAVFLENFTRASIRGIPVDVEAVSSSAKSFVILFDSLISTNAFEEVQVTVEGMDESCTVRQLLEDYDNNRIGEDRRVVVSTVDLKRQIDSLIDDTSSGSKSFEDIDDEVIASTRDTSGSGDKAYKSKMGEGAYSFGQFSPYISQEIYDGLFSQRAEDMDIQEEEEQESAVGFGDSGDESAESDAMVFDDNADIPIEAADIFDDNVDMSDEEINKIISSAKPGQTEESQEEGELSSDDIDSFFTDNAAAAEEEKPENEGAFSPDDIDSFFTDNAVASEEQTRGPQTTRKAPVQWGGLLTPEDVVPLDDAEPTAEKVEPEEKPVKRKGPEKWGGLLSQDDFTPVAEKGEVKKEEAKNGNGPLSAEDIDSFFSKDNAEAKAAEAPADKETLSDDDIDKLLGSMK